MEKTVRKTKNPSFVSDPPVLPAGWQGDERRFAIRIRQLIETLFINQQQLMRRIAALEEEKNASI